MVLFIDLAGEKKTSIGKKKHRDTKPFLFFFVSLIRKRKKKYWYQWLEEE
jgi:uncharacterized UBP type Zn finger protein